jgi:hypothetical protein
MRVRRGFAGPTLNEDAGVAAGTVGFAVVVTAVCVFAAGTVGVSGMIFTFDL